MKINNLTQNALHRQEIYSPQWLILCMMMLFIYNIELKATDAAYKILTLLKPNSL